MRKRELMVIGREQSLASAMDLVQAGVSVDVVGSRGSGRSAFLKSLRIRLEEEEWTVVSVRGVASLRQHPLAALHLSGIGTTSGTRPAGTLFETAEALRHLVRLPRSVIFLDDWDDLDESSWGIAESVRRSAAIPIVLSRLQGLRARHTPSGLPASTLEPSYVIDMVPLRFEEMESVLDSYLDAPIEAGTMSRIFAKSGGNIGLALSLVDATVREGRMALRGGTEWTAVRDLWSPGLRAVLEAHLENLPDGTRDALEVIAIVGVADIDTVRKLVDWGTLELLEERRMIAFLPSGDRQLVTVVPPLLVEFFRNEPLTARRVRLTELIVERLGAAASASAILAERDLRSPLDGEQEALFVRLLQERARARRIVTAAEWEANPSPATASRYVRALMHTNSSTAKETVARVLSSTDSDSGDSVSRAEFTVLRAQWLAYVGQDLDAAIRELEDAAPTLGPYARMLDATAVRLQANLTSIPPDFSTLLEVTDELPTTVKLALLETQMLLMVSWGRFSDARRVFAQVEALDRTHETHIPRALLGLVMLGEGNGQEATEYLRRGFDEAHGYLDIDAVRAFGAAAALSHIFAGEYGAVDDILDTIFSAGEPAPFPPGLQLSILTTASVVAIRRGQLTAGERFAAELDAIKAPDGPLPGQTHAWPRVQLLAFDGESEQAANLLWKSSIALWERGARFAGMTGMLSALELNPTARRLAIALAHLEEIPEARALVAHAEFIKALLAQDADAMLDSVPALLERGLSGVSLSATQLAGAWFRLSGDTTGQARATKLSGEIREATKGRVIDTARFGATTVILTEREKEVGRLAAEGLSNAEIATRLVLSTRTIESHMHRIMRKLAVTNRRSLRRHVEAFD